MGEIKPPCGVHLFRAETGSVAAIKKNIFFKNILLEKVFPWALDLSIFLRGFALNAGLSGVKSFADTQASVFKVKVSNVRGTR